MQAPKSVRKWYRLIGKKGAATTNAKLTPEQRIARARKGGLTSSINRRNRIQAVSSVLLLSSIFFLLFQPNPAPARNPAGMSASGALRLNGDNRTRALSGAGVGGRQDKPHREIKRVVVATHFRSVRAWRRAGCPLPIQPISHNKDGSLKTGTATAYGDK